MTWANGGNHSAKDALASKLITTNLVSKIPGYSEGELTTAIYKWKETVEARHEQSRKIHIESALPQSDVPEPLESRFRDDPRRSGDPVLDRLDLEVGSKTSVLDVGGRAGRYALPLALRSRCVTVVEPSAAMGEVLSTEAKKAKIENISIVRGHWEEVAVDPAQVVLCAKIFYGVADLETFILKLESHAINRVLILADMTSPQAIFSPLWQAVHEEERINLPAMPELLSALWELDIHPDLEMFEPTVREIAPNRETALQRLRQMFHVLTDTEQDQRLQAIMDELIVPTPNGLAIRGGGLRRQGLVSWRPRNEKPSD